MHFHYRNCSSSRICTDLDSSFAPGWCEAAPLPRIHELALHAVGRRPKRHCGEGGVLAPFSTGAKKALFRLSARSLHGENRNLVFSQTKLDVLDLHQPVKLGIREGDRQSGTGLAITLLSIPLTDFLEGDTSARREQ